MKWVAEAHIVHLQDKDVGGLTADNCRLEAAVPQSQAAVPLYLAEQPCLEDNHQVAVLQLEYLKVDNLIASWEDNCSVLLVNMDNYSEAGLVGLQVQDNFRRNTADIDSAVQEDPEGLRLYYWVNHIQDIPWSMVGILPADIPDAEAVGLEMDTPGDTLEVLDIYILLTVLAKHEAE